VPSQWYENVEGKKESFRVLSVDEDSELIEIEYLDGDVEELDLEAWARDGTSKAIEQPEGWSESDDEDADEDGTTWTTTRMRTTWDDERRRR